MTSILIDPATLPARVYMALLFLPVRLTNIPQLTRLAGSMGSQHLTVPDLSAATALGLAVFATLVTLAVRTFWNVPIGQGMGQQQLLAGHAGILAAVALLLLPLCARRRPGKSAVRTNSAAMAGTAQRGFRHAAD